MSHAILRAEDAYWRPSNQMGVLNTDLAKQLSASTLGARLWRLTPGQASTRHRHLGQHELYIVIQGTGRIRVEHELLTLTTLSSLLSRARIGSAGFQRHGCRRTLAGRWRPTRGRQHPPDEPRAARHALPRRTQSPSARTLRHVKARPPAAFHRLSLSRTTGRQFGGQRSGSTAAVGRRGLKAEAWRLPDSSRGLRMLVIRPGLARTTVL